MTFLRKFANWVADATDRCLIDSDDTNLVVKMEHLPDCPDRYVKPASECKRCQR